MPRSALAPEIDVLWGWACAEARELRERSEALQRDAPNALHSPSGDRDEWGVAPPDSIRGQPFTRRFARRLDRPRGLLPNAPIVRALRALRYTPGDAPLRRDMFRIAEGVLRGETDREALRARLGLASFAFTTAAVHGLRALRAAAERDSLCSPPVASAFVDRSDLARNVPAVTRLAKPDRNDRSDAPRIVNRHAVARTFSTCGCDQTRRCAAH